MKLKFPSEHDPHGKLNMWENDIPFQHDIPFPKVGYISSLEGNQKNMV